MSSYPTPVGDGLGPLIAELTEIRRRLSELEIPTGTSQNSLVAQVQAALANIDATVAAAIAANSYTKAQIDSKIANPGTIAPADVNASGQITSGPSSTFVSTYARNNSVVTSYVAAYIQSDGKFLATPSSVTRKRDITTYDGGDWRAIRTVLYRLRARYILDLMNDGDGSSVPFEVGVIAEELVAAGFPELVVFNASGRPQTVHYERIGVVAIAAAQELDSRLAVIEEKLGIQSQ